MAYTDYNQMKEQENMSRLQIIKVLCGLRLQRKDISFANCKKD